MFSNNVTIKPRQRVVDCIVVAPEVHNNGSQNRGAQYSSTPRKKLSRSSKSLPSYTVTVINRVKLVNEELSIKNIPYRYEIHSDKNQLIVDAVFLNASGNVTCRHTQKVTPENFETILDSMFSGRGFIFDD